MHNFLDDLRFDGIRKRDKNVLLASATPHEEEEIAYIRECYEKGWITTFGDNIDAIEQDIAAYMSKNGNQKYAVALNSGTAAIHMAIKLAAEKIYGSSSGVSSPDGKRLTGSLYGKKVFVADMTFNATVNPLLYEGGEPVFIDSEYETWNMDPVALKKAFEIYPDVKLVILVHLYGVQGKIEECKKICDRHGAILIEDAAESLGANVTFENGNIVPSGGIGDYSCISMNGNKILTGSSGGILICPDEYSYEKAKKWSTQAKEAVPWYEHRELGYNYRISNIIAGIIRGQWPHLNDHIEGKKRVFDRYRRSLNDLPVTVHGGGNYWLTTILIDEDAMEPFYTDNRSYLYKIENGKSCPGEILEALNTFQANGRPIWKPMHLQPLYHGMDFVSKYGKTKEKEVLYTDNDERQSVSTDIFVRGLCLPSDNKMTEEEQDVVIDIIQRCFR